MPQLIRFNSGDHQLLGGTRDAAFYGLRQQLTRGPWNCDSCDGYFTILPKFTFPRELELKYIIASFFRLKM